MIFSNLNPLVGFVQGWKVVESFEEEFIVTLLIFRGTLTEKMLLERFCFQEITNALILP